MTAPRAPSSLLTGVRPLAPTQLWSCAHRRPLCHPRAWPEDPALSDSRRPSSALPGSRERFSDLRTCGTLGPRAKPEDDIGCGSGRVFSNGYARGALDFFTHFSAGMT